jgi:predicted ATP-dependent serine protease
MKLVADYILRGSVITKGVIFNRCGGIAHYWLKNKWSYQCKSCEAWQSLRSETIMESSNLSFLIWYKTFCLMSATKKGFSSKEIQRQLGLKRYEPVWDWSIRL